MNTMQNVFFRNAKIIQIVESTSEKQRMTILKEIFKDKI